MSTPAIVAEAGSSLIVVSRAHPPFEMRLCERERPLQVWYGAAVGARRRENVRILPVDLQIAWAGVGRATPILCDRLNYPMSILFG